MRDKTVLGPCARARVSIGLVMVSKTRRESTLVANFRVRDRSLQRRDGVPTRVRMTFFIRQRYAPDRLLAMMNPFIFVRQDASPRLLSLADKFLNRSRDLRHARGETVCGLGSC